MKGRCFGIKLTGTEQMPDRPVELGEGKGGLNHICFEVEDIDEAPEELKAKGIPLLDSVPRTGHAGACIAFIDPSATGNCLVALAQLADGGH